MTNSTKSVLKSKTNWGILLAAVPTILRVAGVPIPPVLDEVIVQAIVVALGSSIGLYGRFVATDKLTLK